MRTQSNLSLLKRATVLFPRTKYTDDSAVRHARRQWVQAVRFMRSGPVSLWAIDHQVSRGN